MINEIINYFKNLNANSIILFGSYARGDFKETSDIDILIISDKKG